MTYEIPEYIVSIKKIKDFLIEGTPKSYDHGAFVKLLLVNGSSLLTEEYFDEKIMTSGFSNFVNGNLRKENLRYAISKPTDFILSINKQKKNSVFEALRDAFDDMIMPDILNSIESISGNKNSYNKILFENLNEMIRKENLYYNELYSEISHNLCEMKHLSDVLALLCLVSIFQDNIYLLFPEKYHTRWSDKGFFPHSPDIQENKNAILEKSTIPLETNAMFKAALSGKSELGDISEIDMAFHSGSDWQRNSDKVDLLRIAIEAKIKLRIIVNTDLIMNVCMHMSQPGKRYVGFDKSVLEWVELSQRYPEILEVHIAKIPLLHRTYIIRNENKHGWINIKYYTYGNYIPEKDQRLCFDSSNQAYGIYAEEFEYLWDNASFKYIKDFSSMVSPSEALSKKLSEDSFSASGMRGYMLPFANNETNEVVNKSSKLFDPDQSLAEVLEKANNGDEKAMICAGIYYYYGISDGKDERRAALWFKKVSALSGDYAPIADKFIARMYYSGSIPREEQSYAKSYEYHLKSAIGDLYSAGQVGFMKSIGSGCSYDYKMTEEYYLQILDQLDNPRKDTLCRFYLTHGEFKKAADIYSKIAGSYPVAAYQLGLLYKHGVLNEPFMPDYSKAAFYLQMAVEGGYLKAAYELGTLYFNPAGDFKKDFQKAHKYYCIAAEHGNAEAQYMLGYMYYYGHIENDIHKSLEYHKMAAIQGHVLSSAHLAILYQIPEIQNYEKAFYYAKYASECGDAPSEFVLGTLYLSGRGCEPDADKAYLCFKHAATNGAPEAKLMLMQMDEMGI